MFAISDIYVLVHVYWMTVCACHNYIVYLSSSLSLSPFSSPFSSSAVSLVPTKAVINSTLLTLLLSLTGYNGTQDQKVTVQPKLNGNQLGGKRRRERMREWWWKQDKYTYVLCFWPRMTIEMRFSFTQHLQIIITISMCTATCACFCTCNIQ